MCRMIRSAIRAGVHNADERSDPLLCGVQICRAALLRSTHGVKAKTPASVIASARTLTAQFPKHKQALLRNLEV